MPLQVYYTTAANLAGHKDPRKNPNYRRSLDSENTRRRRTPEEQKLDRKSSKGSSVSSENEKRRKGRPAWLRSPNDTPLRDGNRDRLMGLLTDRATRTLRENVQEENPSLHAWLTLYMRENRIPKNGNWSDVSGENFLRTLLTTPVEQISGSFDDADGGSVFANASPLGGDPRLIAQRVMDLRHQIAREWMEDLELVAEHNSIMLKETLMNSLGAAVSPEASQPEGGESSSSSSNVDESAGGSDD